MAIDALAEKLGLLLTQGTMPASRLSARDRVRLQGLFDAGVLVEEKSGAGRRVVLTNAESLLAFITRTYPSGLESLSSDLLPRSRAVMEQRDSKKSRGSALSLSCCEALVRPNFRQATRFCRWRNGRIRPVWRLCISPMTRSGDFAANWL